MLQLWTAALTATAHDGRSRRLETAAAMAPEPSCRGRLRKTQEVQQLPNEDGTVGLSQAEPAQVCRLLLQASPSQVGVSKNSGYMLEGPLFLETPMCQPAVRQIAEDGSHVGKARIGGRRFCVAFSESEGTYLVSAWGNQSINPSVHQAA